MDHCPFKVKKQHQTLLAFKSLSLFKTGLPSLVALESDHKSLGRKTKLRLGPRGFSERDQVETVHNTTILGDTNEVHIVKTSRVKNAQQLWLLIDLRLK